MESRERKFDVILLDVDGTLLDFGMSEKQGMKVVLEQYGFEPTEERLLLYHEINEGFWSAFERGEVTKEDLVRQRFETFFGRLGRAVDGREAEELYRRQLDASAFLIDGALELCAYLKDRYDLYVVTNGTSSTQYKRLAASGLDGFMKDIFVPIRGVCCSLVIHLRPISKAEWPQARIRAGITPADRRCLRAYGRIMKGGALRSL